MVLEQLRLDERRWDDLSGERKSIFMQVNTWRRRQPSKWAGNEKEMPEIHEGVGPRKLSLVFSSISVRKEWGKSGKIWNRYFHSPLAPLLETANSLPHFLSPPLFSLQTKSCISLLLDFQFCYACKEFLFPAWTGSYIFVSQVPSQMESLTPRMPGLWCFQIKYLDRVKYSFFSYL